MKLIHRRTLSILLVGLGACRSEPETMDASVPAVDSGMTLPDSGRPDAGIDAGPTDAGPVDIGPSALDRALAGLLQGQDVPVTPLTALPTEAPELVALGELLFFDPILSGNKDVACASCHQAESASADGLPLALGTGAQGRGEARAQGPHGSWARRHTPDLWNRGRIETLFWDGRVPSTSTTGPELPTGLSDPLAIQALHPMLDTIEMRGEVGDMAVDGTMNELAGLTPPQFYIAVQARLTSIPEYQQRFDAVFPIDGITMAGALTAIAAFERDRFDPVNTPWDQYLAGDLEAISDAAKLGAQIFYGPGKCADCHQGALLSDGLFHNVGVPLLTPADEGRAWVDPSAAAFSFRTPPLRNAAMSPPFMHNGSFATLQDLLRHYSNPELSAPNYQGEHLPQDLKARIVTDPAMLMRLNNGLSEKLPLAGTGATPIGLSNIRQFLLQLVDDNVLAQARRVPESVPSGLSVGGP